MFGAGATSFMRDVDLREFHHKGYKNVPLSPETPKQRDTFDEKNTRVRR
jgi:hypothetical protein